MSDYNAIFFDWIPSVPVYHGFDHERFHAADGISRDYTRCGLLVSEYNSGTGRFREPGKWLPMKHARKFGRPCGKCFPVSPADTTEGA